MVRVGVSGCSLLVAVALVISSVFVSCSDTVGSPRVEPFLQQGDTARTLSLVYMVAENSLANYATSDLNEMFAAAKDVPADCYLLAFVDDTHLPRICRFYNIDSVAVCDTVYSFESDFCSSDTACMRRVFDWVLEAYPAEKMNLVLWSHGSGWLREKQSAAASRSIGIDNGNNNYGNASVKALEIDELAAFLGSLPVKTQLLMFDACFMQNVEVAYELRNVCEWILASPAEIPADGAPYDKIVGPLFARDFDASNVMNAYYGDYAADIYGVVLSVVRCSGMEDFAAQTATYVREYLLAADENSYADIFSYLPGGRFYYTGTNYPSFFDINAVMKKFLLAAEYAEWKRALDSVLPYRCASNSYYSAIKNNTFAVQNSYCGMSMYLPQSASKYSSFNRDFRETAWYYAAGWGGF